MGGTAVRDGSFLLDDMTSDSRRTPGAIDFYLLVKPRAPQDLLKSRIIAETVIRKRICRRAVQLRVASIDGLRQPFQGKVLISGMEIRDENIDRSHMHAVHAGCEKVPDAPHGSRVPAFGVTSRKSVLDLGPVEPNTPLGAHQRLFGSAQDVVGMPETAMTWRVR